MYQKILVPIDGSSTSRAGLREAIRLAQLSGGRLRLVHVIDELSFALVMDAYGGYTGDWLGTCAATRPSCSRKPRPKPPPRMSRPTPCCSTASAGRCTSR
jgi:nucleotide-binding universal stress UspA family protein